MFGSVSRLSDILSQIRSTSLKKHFPVCKSNLINKKYKKCNAVPFKNILDVYIVLRTCFKKFKTLNKNIVSLKPHIIFIELWTSTKGYFLPNWSASCFPLSVVTTLSSSISHLLPTRITCALSHEYVLIWVDLQRRFNVIQFLFPNYKGKIEGFNKLHRHYL